MIKKITPYLLAATLLVNAVTPVIAQTNDEVVVQVKVNCKAKVLNVEEKKVCDARPKTETKTEVQSDNTGLYVIGAAGLVGAALLLTGQGVSSAATQATNQVDKTVKEAIKEVTPATDELTEQVREFNKGVRDLKADIIELNKNANTPEAKAAIAAATNQINNINQADKDKALTQIADLKAQLAKFQSTATPPVVTPPVITPPVTPPVVNTPVITPPVTPPVNTPVVVTPPVTPPVTPVITPPVIPSIDLNALTAAATALAAQQQAAINAAAASAAAALAAQQQAAIDAASAAAAEAARLAELANSSIPPVITPPAVAPPVITPPVVAPPVVAPPVVTPPITVTTP